MYSTSNVLSSLGTWKHGVVSTMQILSPALHSPAQPQHHPPGETQQAQQAQRPGGSTDQYSQCAHDGRRQVSGLPDEVHKNSPRTSRPPQTCWSGRITPP